jgi:MFS family permease
LKDSRAFLFYIGQFLSAMGSLTFNLSLVAFMPGAGFDLAQISMILGLQRFVPVFVMGIWGHLTDSFSAKKTVVTLELLAGVLSISLLMVWNDSSTNYFLFLALCIFRAILVNFQTGSRVKLSKLLSDGTYQSNAKHAIWQMKATQGATLFAGLVGIVLIKFLTLKIAIILDFVTFILNGICVLFIPTEEGDAQSQKTATSWRQKFADHFKYNKQAAILDIGLAVSIGGLISFFARVAGADHVWNALFLTSYGLSVWIAGFLERSLAKKFSTVPFWIVMSLSFALLGLFAGPNVESLILMFIKDISYWIILHRISGHIQNDTPMRAIGSVSSARFAIMVVILSIGEILVGAWSNTVPLWAETLGRALVALTIGLALVFSRKSEVIVSDRPAL